MCRLRKVLVPVCAHRELSTVLILSLLQLLCAAIDPTHEGPTLQPRVILDAQRFECVLPGDERPCSSVRPHPFQAPAR